MASGESTAVKVARAHVAAFGNHDFDAVRALLADDVHVVATTVDPMPPKVDTTGVEPYMEGLLQFAQGVLPGKTEVIAARGDDTRALVQVSSRVKFGPEVPEMTLYGSRLYRLDGDERIKEELVIYFVLPE